MACTFSAVMRTILEYMNSDITQVIFMSEIFHTYYYGIGNAAFEDTAVNRWINGVYAVPATICGYYSLDVNRDFLAGDFEEYTLPNVTDAPMLADKLYNIVIADISISEKKRAELTENYPFDNNSDMCRFIGAVIYFALERKFTPNKSKKLTAGTLSPITDEIVIGCEPPKPCKYFCGRDTELDGLHTLLAENDKIFVGGIAGIGKSEFVKAYAKKFKGEYTNILYFNYSGSLKNIITEMDFADEIFPDTDEARFKKHNRFLRSLKSDSLIIIDNFNTAEHKEPLLEVVMKYNCKVIFTTRSIFENGCAYELKEISDINILVELFSKFYSDTDNNRDIVVNIIEAVHHHTMAAELSARLLQKGIFEPNEILRKLEESSADPHSEDKIGMNKDGVNTKATYYGHVRTLFSLYMLDEKCKYVMRCMAFVSGSGIRIKLFARWAGLTDLNEINDLIETGFIRNDVLDTVFLHPMLRNIALADLKPDFETCAHFIGSVHDTCLAIGADIDHYKTVLNVSENISRFAVKNDMTAYIRFIEDAFGFMDKYRYESGMITVISQLSDILNVSGAGTDNDRALLYSFRASYENTFTENISKAISLENKALSLCAAEENPVLTANINMNLGNLYIQKNDLSRAEKFLETSMKIFVDSGIPTPDVFTLARNYAYVLSERGDREKALSMLLNFADRARKEHSAEYAGLAFDAAVIYTASGKAFEAAELFGKAFAAYPEEEKPVRKLKAAALFRQYGLAIPKEWITEELP